MIECEEIANDLFKLIRPYYKNMRSGQSAPEFKRSLTSEEVTELLEGIHRIVLDIKKRVLDG